MIEKNEIENLVSEGVTVIHVFGTFPRKTTLTVQIKLTHHQIKLAVKSSYKNSKFHVYGSLPNNASTIHIHSQKTRARRSIFIVGVVLVSSLS